MRQHDQRAFVDEIKNKKSQRQNDVSVDPTAEEAIVRLTNVNDSNKWTLYSQTLLDKGIVEGFAIYSIHGSHQAWTRSLAFNVKLDEINGILNAFGDDSDVRLNGFRLQGRQFIMTRLSPNRVMMCGRDSICGTGCVIYPCHTCVIIATHPPQHISTCYSAIETLGDFLTRNGF